MTENNTRRPVRSKPKRRRKRKLRVIPAIILTLLVLMVISAGVLVAWIIQLESELPDWDSATLMNSQTSFLYDSEGDSYTQLHAGENRIDVTIDDIPDYVIDLLVANEDTRYYDHFGVDIIRIFGALIVDIKTMSFTQGASTITMQVAKNAILEDQGKTIERKVKEAILAIELDYHYSKDEILVMYFNESFWGSDVYGIEAASQYYFSKSVSDLTLGEAATLIGMLPSPNAYSPLNDIETATERRDKALTELIKYYPEYETEATLAMAEELVVDPDTTSSASYEYPWFTDAVIDEAGEILTSLGLSSGLIYTGGLNIYTTLVPTIQDEMEVAYADDSMFPSSSTLDIIESAMTMIDVDTGAIVGLIGGREYTTKLGYNRATDMLRQPGSVFKPIAVYAPLIESGGGSGDVANDILTSFGISSEPYTPNNYDYSFDGVITARQAVEESKNVVAVKFLQQVGISAAYNMATSLGIDLVDDDKNLAIALGGLTYGLNTTDIAAAYAAFANEGIYNEPYLIEMITDYEGNVIYQHTTNQTIAMSEETAYIMTDMLVSVTTDGTGYNAAMSGWDVASKTGTVQLPDLSYFSGLTGNRDAWFAAYNTQYVGVVWMGYDNDLDADGNVQYLNQIYGGKYPALLWKQVMTAAVEGMTPETFTQPSSVVSVEIDTKSGLLPSELTPEEYISTEIYASGTEPTTISNVWSYVEICDESGEEACIYCPNTTLTLVYTPPTESSNNEIVGDVSESTDADIQAPTTVCSIHTEALGEMYEVAICTDPSHDHEVLANIAVGYQDGGCPEEYIVFRSFYADSIPTEYCDITDHQTTGSILPDTSSDDDSDADTDDESTTLLTSPHDVSYLVSGSDDDFTLTISWLDDYNAPGLAYEIEIWALGDSANTQTYSTYSRSMSIDSLSEDIYYYRIRGASYSSNAFSEWSDIAMVNIK